MATSIIRGLHNIPSALRGAVLTIGNFDGLHVGHQALLSCLLKKGAELSLPTCVMLFEPQPVEFINPSKPLARLMSRQEKISALTHSGVDYVLVINFNTQFAELTAEDFVKEILVNRIQISHLIIGDDFRFGKNRRGDVELLNSMGASHFTIEKVQTILIEGKRVSSTRIRHALLKADFSLATHLLGRPYTMTARVVRGRQLGRNLGFKTANLLLYRANSPLHGIYAVRVHGLHVHTLPGVASLGTRPAVGGQKMILEVHIFDFDQDIYGKRISIEFCKKLRDEAYFSNLQLLSEQIARDVVVAKKYFHLCP